MHLHLATNADRVGFVYQLNISFKKLGVDEIFVVDLKKGVVFKGPYEGKSDTTFCFTANNFLAISSGRLNPQMAFIWSKLKIKGSINTAQKFMLNVFPKPSKL